METFRGIGVNTIHSTLSGSKVEPVYECPKCGFEGIFKSDKCAKCGQSLKVPEFKRVNVLS